MVSWSLAALAAVPEIEDVVLVTPAGLEGDASAALGHSVRLHRTVAGGMTRSRSVLAGLDAVPAEAERVLVQDAARPLLTPELAAAVLAALEDADGAIAAAPLADTLKRVDDDLRITGTPDRAGLWLAQTPQAFRARVLRQAFDASDPATLDAATDCAALVEACGGRVRVVPVTAPNLKVTVPSDLALAEALLRAASGERPGVR
jgi:2-C-methyl-D-erythritol 4-phosphate cytidylyltransferase/2-C-methyl-D-erythritol 2,4-cyclodiphosphate synthase